MKRLLKFGIVKIVILVILLQSCANYRLNYGEEATGWNDKKPSADLNIEHSIYLIGDTGNASLGKTIPHFKYLKEDLDQASKNSSIIFLGDNIYPSGMPRKSDERREEAEHKLQVQLDLLTNYKGEIMFIPGNHDWAEFQTKGLHRQEKFIEKNLNRVRNGTDDKDDKEWEDFFFPSGGCGDPHLIEVSDQLVIILIDSEWWIQNWDTDQSINQGCRIKTRAGFYRDFENLVRKYKNRNVVIAMHHPLFSNGQHGGKYTFENHIFPLRFLNKKAYVPLPGLGSAIAIARASIGVPQDLASAKYRAFKEEILAAIGKNGSYIVASGHEHNLQYLEEDGQQFIISGSGSKTNAAGMGGGGQFSYGQLGYSKLDFYEDGSTWLYFYALNEDESGMEEVYRKKIREKLAISPDNIPDEYPEFEKRETVKLRKPTNFEFKKPGPIHRVILGKHYSDIYLKEYPFDVLDLSTYRGGMAPLKRGGGNQTNSLRLADAKGRQFAMRALTKDASRALPYPINQITQAKNILQDNFMAAYPFAALAVPDMAEAANIYHTNPKLFYIPKQPALDLHNDLFGGDVYLIEERPGGDWSDLESFGNSEKIISTLDLIEKITKNRKHRIDQNWVVRSRLFDLIIKDWDRHEDQWRWASFEDEKGKFYRPIPRDRDQPFAKYDGLVSSVTRLVNPFMRQLQTYSPEVKNIKWESWNSTYFDQTFLGELEWEDWKKEAEYLRDNITDEVIEASFEKIPIEAQNEEWRQLVEYTKKRRDNIVEFARESYELKSKIVDVLGTSKKDLFIVDRLTDDKTKIEVYELSKKGNKKDIVYKRIFDHDVTKEVHLYGLEDNDIFEITGDVKKSLKLRIIGGEGKDKVVDNSNVSKGGKKTLIYDSSTEKNKFELGSEGKDKTSLATNLNTYDRRSHHYDPNFWIPLPVISYAPDDGLIIGANATFFNYQFKKEPYGQKHQFNIDYSLTTQALNFNYDATYIEAIGKWDLSTELEARRNRFAFNYFGFGNESLNTDPDELEFNRVRQSRLAFSLLFQKRFAYDNGTFSIGPSIERTRIEDTANRFVTSSESLLAASAFEEIIYTGIRAKFKFENLDTEVNPHKGIKLDIGYKVETALNGSDFTFGEFGVKFTIYQAIDPKGNFIFASQAGFDAIQGDFDFFKAPTIGGDNLRGFRKERFRGDRAFFHTTDLRIKLFNSINKVLPFTFGIHGGFEYGRVWEDSDSSDTLHTSYGGGFWLDPIDFLVISFGQYYSEEDSRFIFKLNHMF